MNLLEGRVGAVRPALQSDIEPVAANMRESDRIELRDSSMLEPRRALEESLERSSMSFTVTMGDEPVAMFGVGPLKSDPTFGVVWFLATNRMEQEGRRDLRVFSPFFVECLSRGFSAVGNLIDLRNKMSIKWLQRLGFRWIETIINPVTAVPFALMVRETASV